VPVDQHTITLDGSPVFYRSAPWIGTPVLYLHGIPTSSDDWTAFLERTGGVAPDLPGFGRSGKGGHLDYTLDGLATFVARLLSQLELQRVRLVAHDWGAGAGLVFAQREPERIERLVLCDALPLLEGFRWPRVARLLRRPLVGELAMGSTSRAILARTLRRACARPDAWSDAALDAVWNQFDQGTQRAILRLHRATDPAPADLASLRMPALVIWGENDPWFDAEFADAYAERLPDATAQRIPDAGHWPWLDQPDVIARIASFVR
jgi:pimeloyl-ACP methyl ester carboxylesterase